MFVEFIFQCGIDVNKANFYDQIVLDIVNFYIIFRVVKDFKYLLKGKLQFILLFMLQFILQFILLFIYNLYIG